MKLLKKWQQGLERRHSACDLTRPGQRPGELFLLLEAVGIASICYGPRIVDPILRLFGTMLNHSFAFWTCFQLQFPSVLYEY